MTEEELQPVNDRRAKINALCEQMGIDAHLDGNMAWNEYVFEQDKILLALLTELAKRVIVGE